MMWVPSPAEAAPRWTDAELAWHLALISGLRFDAVAGEVAVYGEAIRAWEPKLSAPQCAALVWRLMQENEENPT